MKNRLALAMIVVAAISLPAVMTAVVFYASDAAIGDPAGGLRPQYGNAPHPTAATVATQPTEDHAQTGGGRSGPATTGTESRGGGSSNEGPGDGAGGGSGAGSSLDDD